MILRGALLLVSLFADIDSGKKATPVVAIRICKICGQAPLESFACKIQVLNKKPAPVYCRSGLHYCLELLLYCLEPEAHGEEIISAEAALVAIGIVESNRLATDITLESTAETQTAPRGIITQVGVAKIVG